MAQHNLRQRLKAQLDALVDELLDAPQIPQTIDQIEDAALRLRDKAARIVSQELAREQTPEGTDQQHKTACSCGRWARDKGRRSRQIQCLSGQVTLVRRYFYCRRCDKGFCPADERLGIREGQGYTTRLVQQVVRVSTLLPYSGAVNLLQSLAGVSVCAKEAQRLCIPAAAVADAYLQQRKHVTSQESYTSPVTPDVLYVEADGVHTPIRSEQASCPPLLDPAQNAPGGSLWKEMKVGTVRALKANGVEALPVRYVSFLGDAETFGQYWNALALECGALQARQLAVIGDGASWIWRQASFYFPWAVKILDFYHASEYLWECGRAAFGEECGAWVGARKEELLQSDLSGALSALSALSREYASASDVVEKTCTYFQNHAGQMDYARYRQMGLRIGSGAAESGCKQVVTQRLKGAGMRWSVAGAQGMASLRCFVLSGLWESFTGFWNQQPIAACA